MGKIGTDTYFLLLKETENRCLSLFFKSLFSKAAEIIYRLFQ